MKENRFFILAVVFSLVLHFYLFRFDNDFFSEEEAGIYIPVTLTPESNIVKEKPSEHKELIVPELPGDIDKTGAVFRRGSLSRLTKRYIEIVAKEIEKRKFNPPDSRYYGLIGNVTVGFTIGPYGRFHNIIIISSSGDRLLDATALRAVKDTDGRIKRPAWAGSKTLKISLVIKYQYRL